MARILASLVVAASLLTRGLRPRLRPGFAARPASARAAGRAASSVVDAKTVGVAAMRAQQPGTGLHDPVVSARRLRQRRSARNRQTPGQRPGFFISTNAASISALTPTSASGVSTSTSAALPSTGTSTTASRIAADQVARADVAFDRHQVGKEAPRPQHRIAALALDGRHHHQRAALRIEGGDQPVDQARIDLRHVAEADDRAVGIRRHRRDAGLERGAEALGEIRIVHEPHRQARRAPPRPRRADGRSPRSPAARARPAPARRRCAPAAGRRSRRAACSARPCGSSGRRRARPRRCAAARSPAGSARGCGRVTISISSPPTPMPVISSRGTGKAGEQPHQHPVEAVFLRRARAARRAEHRPAARVADQQQIAGIDRHAEMLDAPADRLDRGRDHVAPVGDGRGAEHDDQLGALVEHLLDRLRERALLVRHAALGDDRGARPARAARAVTRKRLLDHLGRPAPAAASRRRRSCGS